jgi:hypothetical protein
MEQRWLSTWRFFTPGYYWPDSTTYVCYYLSLFITLVLLILQSCEGQEVGLFTFKAHNKMQVMSVCVLKTFNIIILYIRTNILRKLFYSMELPACGLSLSIWNTLSIWNLNIHGHHQKSPPLDIILYELNKTVILWYFLKSNFNIILPSMPRSPLWFRHFRYYKGRSVFIFHFLLLLNRGHAVA